MDIEEDFINDVESEIDSDVEIEDDDDIERKIIPKKSIINNDDNDNDNDDEINEDDIDDDMSDIDDDIDSSVNDDDSIDNRQNTNAITSELRNFELSDDDDYDDDDDENYHQKFDDSINGNIIKDFHPELASHNYEEIALLTKVVKDENGIIIDPLHQTIPFITKYEKARIIGERAKQINSGAQPLIDIDPTTIDGYLIALKEFNEKKTPFIVKRPLPNGGCEYWKLSDLEILD
jgi:DNA-directed RNA polymerase I, II, and III subunit RPABC2